MGLTSEQIEFFRTFGYVHLPAYMADELAWIEEEHARLFVEFGVEPDGEHACDVIPFIAQSDAFIRLLEHPKVLAALTPIVGDNFNYLGSDGHYYAGEVDFHPDGDRHVGLFVKFAMYLDRLTAETGCLRVIPGSHHQGAWRDHAFKWGARGSRSHHGIESDLPPLGPDLPGMPLANEPGDVVLFNHRTFHASFGGNAFRRMFAINVGTRAHTSAEVEDLDSFLRFCNDTRQPLYSQRMLEWKSAEVQRHLEQPVERELALWGEHRLSVTANRRAANTR